jgi:hypothetical protein
VSAADRTYLLAYKKEAIASLPAPGIADKRIDGHYAAMALEGMVARFASANGVSGRGVNR